jgi:hypothetical protein
VMRLLGEQSMVQSCSWGGCRVDLIPSLWRAKSSEIIRAWNQTQEILASSGFFAKLIRPRMDAWDWRPGTSRDLYQF